MNKNKTLQIAGTLIDERQLQDYLQKIALQHNLTNKSDKRTYPVPGMIANFKFIKKVYNLLDEHVKLGINIHPAGEWLLDNIYIIEEIVKQIEKELTIKKYENFVGLQNGEYAGFARIYVLASEIIAYTDNNITSNKLETLLSSYQTKKSLNMEEMWNIGIFLQISIIQNIREICDKIYICQIEKYRAEAIVERLVENKTKDVIKFKNNIKEKDKLKTLDIKSSFIEYMSYILKRYGKKGNIYLNVLEETVEVLGTSISEITKKEHYDIALKKVSIGNAIISLKKIQRIKFLDIFEKINGVEELLRKDPLNIYENMDIKTKEDYRNKIKEISRETKVSEIYITRKVLELAENNFQKRKEYEDKKSHIGYYLISDGINILYNKLDCPNIKELNKNTKINMYIFLVIILSFLISFVISNNLYNISESILIGIISFIIFLIPSSEVIIQIIQHILGKMVKPKLIPKMNYMKGIPEDKKTMVIIPTILKTSNKVEELVKKLEVYYLANKSENIYFTLLGDVAESDKKEENYDNQVIEKGLELINKLNQKYKVSEEDIEKFNFIYRKREWNESEESYLGWERKRGMISMFNKYILGRIKNLFRINTFEINNNQEKLKGIKYVITLDADTDLVLNSALELVGSMSHILNKPELNENLNRVEKGYGIMQPRVGINLDISYKSIFTKIFAGTGGIDSYSNAISDIYQDNFGEGIFTGKGIYDVKIFEDILQNQIPENTVLSHDLLEGNYLRCGLVSDIVLMDGYPTKYNSYITRLARWTRGDWQILKWASIKSPLNILSKYKIIDNIRRSLFEISIIISMIYANIIGLIKAINIYPTIIILGLILISPFILEFIDRLFFKLRGNKNIKTFSPRISGIKGIIYKSIIIFSCLPHKAFVLLKSIVKTIYRMCVSKKKLLEWMTSEEAEKQAKSSLPSYFNQMSINLLAGVVTIGISLLKMNFVGVIVGILWFLTPIIMWYISKEIIEKQGIELLEDKDKKYVKDIAKRTWEFFEEYLIEENNYLITDNYQEDRKNKIVDRTSSTNIGLSLVVVISAYDMGFINKEKCIELITNIILVIESLQKWNGHLYNWYNIKTKEPLVPRYVSTVDSGNFIGYMYVVKTFLEENIDKNKEYILEIINNIIENTDFKYLYNEEQQLFSIGYNIEENKLTDSYYDLLASEARQASLIAIAKKDVSVKHFDNLSKTLTTYGKYRGLISWSGTAFEYLMPNINIPSYKGSLLDESSKFLVKTQMEYCNKLNIPWGISESAFNLKDLNGNYQYKAFGVPWIGLKRGLADEQVIAPYGSILGIDIVPKEEIINLKKLESIGMYNKYGFYEAVDFTPERMIKGKRAGIVKTYMAHHQALIMISLNNFFNNKIIQKRFTRNPEISAITILLQEIIPSEYIITKEQKEKIPKFKYEDYEGYSVVSYNKIDERLITGNVISSKDYVVAMNQKGEGFSKYKDIYVNRFKQTDEYSQGIFTYIKNIKNKEIWSTNYTNNKTSNYKITFMPDKMSQEIVNGNIRTSVQTTITSDEPTELRRIKLTNMGLEDEVIEITSYFEPVLSSKEQDYSHQAFNNLFLITKYDEKTNSLIVRRKSRTEEGQEYKLGVTLSTNSESIGDLEYEIDGERFFGRGEIQIPNAIKNSIPLNKKIGLVTEPVVALKRTLKIKAGEEAIIDLIIAISEEENNILKQIEKYKVVENVGKEFELAKARVDAESRYLRIKGEENILYQKILSYILFDNSTKQLIELKNEDNLVFKQEKLWKYGISGDLPIIFIKISNVNEGYVVREVLKAFEFFKSKNIEVDIVILDEEKHSYENYVREEIENRILNQNMGYLKNVRAGIFVISKDETNENDVKEIEFLAKLIIDGKKGGIENNLKELEEIYLENNKEIVYEQKNNYIDHDDTENINILKEYNNLKYNNEYGAFSEDGKEYLISIDRENRLPTVWSNILANEKFGTLVTENMGGYTWYKNSRLNRVSSWSNNPVYDIPNEVIYLKNKENGKTWSLGLNPMPDDKKYNVIYGFGYVRYIHQSEGIEQILDVYVPKEESCKIQILSLKNLTASKKKLKMYYYIKPVIGEDEIKSNGYINIKFDKNNNIITAKNLYKDELEDTNIYLSCSEKIKSYTGNKNFFLGKGGLQNPDGIKKVMLNNQNSLFKNTCVVYEVEIELESHEKKEISIIMGAEEDIFECKSVGYKYSKIQNAKNGLENIKRYWKETLTKLQVYTETDSINILLNGWIPYQILTSRLYGRTGYYQSGGAYGFRDQLQDTFGLKYLDSNLLKNQIIKHSKHQFLEGDVEHWWHDETGRGIRTRFSDDLLWLVYAVIEYIKFTGDYSILEIKTKFKEGNILEEGTDEKYDIYQESEEDGSIYDHIIRAIEKSLDFGENGIPKIGSGDWNDGFSTVGNKGIGESVWLGFFIFDILTNTIQICERKEDKHLVNKYEEIRNQLKKSLNINAWDGRWYKRAFMDDGNVLGSMENEECRIDSLAQSWSVISNAGENDKKYICMENLENHLIDKENKIIKLLDPPFEKSKLKPGYIKAYLPGVRENGGQYTHAATWVIIAQAMLGFSNKAMELYKMINPIEHSKTKDLSKKYKVEPYVIPADIYGTDNLAGRGGWTWYTGSASWYYKAGIENILGFKIENGYINIDPIIPKEWKEYKIQYKWQDNIYNIHIKNPNGKDKVNYISLKEKEKLKINNELDTHYSKILLNGIEVDNLIKLEKSNIKIYNIDVIM